MKTLEPARELGQLPQQRLSEPFMSCVVGMEQIFGIVIIDRTIDEREETGEGVGVYHRHGPHVASLLDALHIGILIQSAAALDILLRLQVLVVGIEDSTMDRCEQDDLLVGIIFFDELPWQY